VSRRLIVLLALTAVAVAGTAFTLIKRSGSSSSDYRVDVIFDQARGLIPGQLVEIAGARVGTIDDVSLTGDFKARLSLKVDRRFAPFHSNATCTIRPQGLIAENFVQCDPGTPAAKPLRGEHGKPPTVPVTHTTEPVSLTDLFEIWNVPTRDRLGVLLSQLGMSTAGRGADMNAILRRANPSLAAARRLIGQLEAQRTQLAGAVDDTSTALARLAPHAPGATKLIDNASAVLSRTGAHRTEISQSVARLPALLSAARPALQSLDTVGASGAPLLARIREAAPQLVDLTYKAPALARSARPALARLGPVLDEGVTVIKRARPLTNALAVYAHQSLPSAKLAGPLLENLQQRGFVANLMRFFYYAAEATARYDSTSHILPAHIAVGPCANYATAPVSGCSANFGGSGATPASKATATPAQQRATDQLLRYLLR
jgi:ABC-type transporter Mla subunit MlaD